MNSYWKKFFLATILLVLITSGIGLFLTKSIVDVYKSHKSDYSQKQEELLSALDKLDALQKIRKNSKEFETKSQEVEILWPETPEVSRFMVQTEGLAKELGYIMQNFSISEKKAAAKPKAEDPDKESANEDAKPAAAPQKNSSETHFSFNTNVSFPKAIEIIRRMETFPRFNSITQLSISSKNEEGVDLNLTGKLYYGK